MRINSGTEGRVETDTGIFHLCFHSFLHLHHRHLFPSFVPQQPHQQWSQDNSEESLQLLILFFIYSEHLQEMIMMQISYPGLSFVKKKKKKVITIWDAYILERE